MRGLPGPVLLGGAARLTCWGPEPRGVGAVVSLMASWAQRWPLAGRSLPSKSRQAPRWPPGLRQPPPCGWRAAGRAGPAPPGPGSWQACPAVAGVEFPAFLVGRMALESYLLCLWHQLASGHVAVCVRPEPGTRGLLGCFLLARSTPPPPPRPCSGMAVSEQAQSSLK